VWIRGLELDNSNDYKKRLDRRTILIPLHDGEFDRRWQKPAKVTTEYLMLVCNLLTILSKIWAVILLALNREDGREREKRKRILDCLV
jgi:hypothetical protein